MFTTNTEDILLSTSTGIKDILYRILEERNFDVPEEFIKYIDFMTLTRIMTTNNYDSSVMKKLIDNIYPKMMPDMKERFLIILFISYCNYECIDLFSQDDIAKVVKNKLCNNNIADSIIMHYIDNNIVVEKTLMQSYIHTRMKNIRKPFIRINREPFVYKYIVDIFVGEMKLQKHKLKYVLPSLCELISGDVTREYTLTDRDTMYQYIDEFIVKDSTLDDILTYMTLYNNKNKFHEIPQEIISLLYKYDSTKLSPLSDEYSKLHSIKKLIRKSVLLNANNVYLIYWVSPAETDSLIVDIAKSKTPIKDLHHFMTTFGIRKSIDDSLISKMIESGVKISSLIPYMSDVKKFIPEIFSIGLFNSFVFDNRLNDYMNIENEPNEYFLDILRIDYEVTTVSGEKMRFLDYVIQNEFISNFVIYYSIEKAIFSTRDIFMSLSSETVSILLTGKDKKIYKTHPETITVSVYNSLSQTELNEIIIENPTALQYIPPKYVDVDVLYKSLKTHNLKYTPLMSDKRYPIPSELVAKLILYYDIGYGYIADVPTVLQRDAIIDAVINKFLREEMSVYN